ncbi:MULTISPECIES: DUF4296 domain-containing protein [unclassified Tenacibaculum]|uniref:DUF4296 domain-containing protein n=1 Tax=unclassified Tenacibaculum TaxID=2635139 RepID=UPI001F357CD9|nr:MULTISPECIES: DUF4296 domain-containing protein [unclassified Tenacibaculum]MCF2874584.1 DUF4296 domain-containing protein [Tenacibaculum sp. Cn5-1]MCF2934350.1 DUF4296 domain-containing protein [Tenacibaculum sp. Cn5-34]MCG7510560.1 DUF4296 domain-containing protein [Tenacibaculum sp. Cn5-46]
MKKILYITVLLFLASCTSNTIYKKPKDLIPKDSMISLLTDMYIASSAKNVKNKFLKKEKNYVFLVYEKYKIDSTRFDKSNDYYTSKIEEYTVILGKVKLRIDSIQKSILKKRRIQDSLNNKTKPQKKMSLKLEEKNEKLSKNKKISKEIKE